MSAPVLAPDRVPPGWGGPLTEAQYAGLGSSWITREIADAAMLRRVTDQEGRESVGHSGKLDCSGVLFPYYWPGESSPRAYRLRRDRPEIVQGKDGSLKQKNKYLGAPGEANRLYFPPGVTSEQLAQARIPVVLVEGEKKALAASRLAMYESEQPRFIALAIPGVWNWRGTVAKTGGPNGERLDVKGPIPDLDRIEWRERIVFIIFDSNVHTNAKVKAARAALVRELTGRGATTKTVSLPADCGVNGMDDLLGIWGPDRVLKLIDGAVDAGSIQIVPPPQFEFRPTGIYRISTHGDHLRQTQLTNFNAAIARSVVLDDGIDTSREFEIEAQLMERKFKFAVPAAEFASLDWAIERVGPGATVYAGQRESARVAMQSSAVTAFERYIYTHTGWRNVDDRWIYLHAAGAVSADGLLPGEVRLAGALSRYELRLPSPGETAGAVRASLGLAGLVPSVNFPLHAAACRAVFGDADFAVHLAGETGAFKSELAALFQQHFGAGMDRLHLPGSWASTGNSLEVLAFQAKDALLVIDDFAPQGSSMDVARYHATAERVFRAAGNRAGRGRLDSTAKLREAKPPRSLILSTGEDVPRGHSVRARLLVLELAKGSILPCDLAVCQANARKGLYVAAFSSFIQWMASRFERVRATLGSRVVELRAAVQNASHARTPEIAANLQAAFEAYLDFAVDCAALGPPERDRVAGDCWHALLVAASAQEMHQRSTDPVAMYLTLLRSLLSSGRAHIIPRNGSVPDDPALCGWRWISSGHVPAGECIGWLDGEDIYIDPTTAYRQIQLAAAAGGENLPVSPGILKRRLKEKGLLASVDDKRETNTVRRSIAGSTKDVLHFRRSTVFPNDIDDEAGRRA
jgi:hypothetical protein